MAEINFKNRLQMYGYDLTKGEQKIADYILLHPDKATVLSIVSLAQDIGTSSSTITRFCQKLHYRNFAEFQSLLLTEQTPVKAPNEVVEKIHYYYDNLIKSTSEMIQSDTLTAFITAITSAGRIMICGIGSSGITANEMANRLMRMGLDAVALTDSHLMLFQAALFQKNDLVVAISNSGKSKEVIRTCTLARESGVRVFSLTQRNHTPLTELSDHALFSSNIAQMNDDRFINSQLPLLFIVDVLTHMLLENSPFADAYARTVSLVE